MRNGRFFGSNVQRAFQGESLANIFGGNALQFRIRLVDRIAVDLCEDGGGQDAGQTNMLLIFAGRGWTVVWRAIGSSGDGDR